MMWTDDPVLDSERYAREQDRKAAEGPICCECGEPVYEDFYYRFEDDILCESCVEKHLVWIR